MGRQELHSYIQEHQPNICRISALQNGNEIYSAQWNGYQRTDCIHAASAAKRVMALLIGMAFCKKIHRLQLLDFLPKAFIIWLTNVS